MKIRLSLVAVFIFAVFVSGQEINPARTYAELITEDGLRDYLNVLASDALEGRETGTRGQKMAAAFIKYHFQDYSLTGPINGDYFQPVTLYTSAPGDIYIKSGERKFQNFKDIVYYGTSNSQGEISLPVIWVGNGTRAEFDQVNVQGKAVLIKKSEDSYRVPLAVAREKKAGAIIFYHEQQKDFVESREQWREYLSDGLLSLEKPQISSLNSGVFFVSPEVAAQVMKIPIEKLTKLASESASKRILNKVKQGSLIYQTGMDIKTLKSENVLGYLEGSDKKDELLVITAHYDHIGKLPSGHGDLINNGADDDGSGTVALMQIAKAFSQAKAEGKGPRRSILFLAVTGEEKGLLGSDYYTQFPTFPLSSTIVNLNIDMIGRKDPDHKESAPYVYVIGADKLSSKLNAVSESVNKKNHKLIFDYTYNDPDHPDRLYYRSDHWNFAKNNIPVIFYFDGIHEDYHKPSDEVDKIEFRLLKLRAQTIFLTAWEIANMDEKIVPDIGK